MPTNPITLLKLCREIYETSHEGLIARDRGDFLAAQKALKALKREVNRTLLRLAFVDEGQLN